MSNDPPSTTSCFAIFPFLPECQRYEISDIVMIATQTLETKACQACAKAKRRCGKETPDCARCKRQGIDCTYPPSKPSCFVLLGDPENEETFSPFACMSNDSYSTCGNSVSHLSAHGDSYTVSSCSRPAGAVIHVSLRTLAFQLYEHTHPLGPSEIHLSSIWFTLPSTWQVTPWPRAAFPSFCAPQVKRLIAQIQQWFAQWISTGSNVFIHAQLYRRHLPRCVQDAYTALSAYLQRTPSNSHLVFHILETRLTQLLTDHGVSPVDANAAHSTCHQPSSADIDTLGHLARVQTLTTYLLIMLFDGDIRLRHIAEQHIPVLDAWLQEMVDNARTTLSLGSLTDPSHSDALWHAWILAESLRRIFFVGRTVVALYATLKAGKPVPEACKGGMVLTIRRGAWEAQSAAEWESMAAEVYLGLMQVRDAREWVQVGGISRGQVDSFARMFLEETCGNG